MNYTVITPSNVTTIAASGTSTPVTLNIPRTLSYQFQVVEFTDKNNKVVKVELQVQQTEHDSSGYVHQCSGFQPVPRIKMPLP